MIQNRQRNKIFSIKNAEGEREIDQEKIEKTLIEYYKGILTEDQNNRGEAINNISKEIPRMVTEEQNKALMRTISMEELTEVVMNMSRNKAPGPDGFTVEFYQACWYFMGKYILEAVEESRMKQRIWPGINATFLSLIPKSNHSDEPQGFRPIALCNVIYKIIATLIAKRLKPLLPSIIAPEQTGFVEGRQILDGIIVTPEVIHSLKEKKQRGMLMKLDLSKAYDRLNWNYLKAILGAYGFENRWIDWILSMISTPNFSVLINGIPSGTFNATRGIRQGDPISPFLFIMVVEGLGYKIKKDVRDNKIRGIRLWGRNLSITHEQFVDDVMLFGDATLKEVRNFKGILEIFMKASGMEINEDKSCTFIFNSPDTAKVHLTRMLGFKQGSFPTKYLGIQLDVNQNRLKNWQSTVDKLKKRLESWSFRSLNIARRIILIKSVLLSIPIYPLSILKAPKGVLSRMREILGKFLWGGDKINRENGLWFRGKI